MVIKCCQNNYALFDIVMDFSVLLYHIKNYINRQPAMKYAVFLVKRIKFAKQIPSIRTVKKAFVLVISSLLTSGKLIFSANKHFNM